MLFPSSLPPPRLTDRRAPGANTNNTAILIGEKGAELAAEFLGVEL